MFGYYPYGYYMDPGYILVMIMAILSLIASARVSSTYNKYSRQLTARGLTAEDAARRILDQNGLYNVRIESIAGNLTDHYDPKANVIRLSDSVKSSTSVAAVGVAAHEAGHAVQYAENYAPIKFRASLVPVVNFGSRFSFVALFLGLFLSSNLLIWAGIILFSFATLFHLVTLPVELNASKRAMETIRGTSLLVDEGEIKGARKVLTAAAMTYIAAVLMSIAQLVRLLAIFGRRRD